MSKRVQLVLRKMCESKGTKSSKEAGTDPSGSLPGATQTVHQIVAISGCVQESSFCTL